MTVKQLKRSYLPLDHNPECTYKSCDSRYGVSRKKNSTCMHVKLKMLKANPAGTRPCTTLKFVRKCVNDLIMSTLFWRFLTNVGSTLAKRHRWSVHSCLTWWSRFFTCILKVTSTLIQRWNNIDNVISTLFQSHERSLKPICIFNLFLTLIKGHFQCCFNA